MRIPLDWLGSNIRGYDLGGYRLPVQSPISSIIAVFENSATHKKKRKPGEASSFTL